MRSGFCGMNRLWAEVLLLTAPVYRTFALPQVPATRNNLLLLVSNDVTVLYFSSWTMTLFVGHPALKSYHSAYFQSYL